MIRNLARHLMNEGHVDNEPDALLAAIQILAVAGEPAESAVEHEPEERG